MAMALGRGRPSCFDSPGFQSAPLQGKPHMCTQLARTLMHSDTHVHAHGSHSHPHRPSETSPPHTHIITDAHILTRAHRFIHTYIHSPPQILIHMQSAHTHLHTDTHPLTLTNPHTHSQPHSHTHTDLPSLVFKYTFTHSHFHTLMDTLVHTTHLCTLTQPLTAQTSHTHSHTLSGQPWSLTHQPMNPESSQGREGACTHL